MDHYYDHNLGPGRSWFCIGQFLSKSMGTNAIHYRLQIWWLLLTLEVMFSKYLYTFWNINVGFPRFSVHVNSHLGFHIACLFWSEAVCFSQHRHNVDLLIQGLHEVHIYWFKTETAQRTSVNWLQSICLWLQKSWDCKNLCWEDVLPMAMRWDEVQTAVHSVVPYVFTVKPDLISAVLLHLLVYIMNCSLPAVTKTSV